MHLWPVYFSNVCLQALSFEFSTQLLVSTGGTADMQCWQGLHCSVLCLATACLAAAAAAARLQQQQQQCRSSAVLHVVDELWRLLVNSK
jgi:hypothetical protein